MGRKNRMCKVVEKDKNFNEIVPTNHKFFRIMIRDFRTKLRIPRKFMANFNEKLPTVISLHGPSGSIMKVKVRRTNGDVIICDGWDQFVKEHVEETDVVVFRYAGNSTFKVLVFDATGCEREQDEDEDEDTEEKKGMVNGKTRNEEKLTAMELAKSYTNQTDKDSFFVVMKPTHVIKFFTLKLPRSWAFQHLPKNLEFLGLRVPPNPKTWLVQVIQNKEMCLIRVGWSKFVSENNLGLDDVCVFELCQRSGSDQNRRKKKVMFDVIIYRAVS